MMDYDAWMCSLPGLYWNRHEKLLRYFGSARAVYDAPDGELDRLEKEGAGWIGVVRQCRNDAFVRSVEETMQRERIRFCPRSSPLFPPLLKQIKDCPAGFFYKGRIPSPDLRLAAVVGARGCTPYGRMMAAKISKSLVRAGFGIVSGMALGIDAYAQEAALEEGGVSAAVLGCGVDRCYPADNISLYTELERRGCLISEFPCSTGPLRSHFPLRNRLISGLCEAVIVVEARKKSGALITTDYALDQGRDVYALPGRVTDPLSEGCNLLIAQGCAVITSPEELAYTLGGICPDEKKGLETSAAVSRLGREQRLVYERTGPDPVSVEELEAATRLPVNVLYRILQELQLEDLILHTPGNRFMRKS